MATIRWMLKLVLMTMMVSVVLSSRPGRQFHYQQPGPALGLYGVRPNRAANFGGGGRNLDHKIPYSAFLCSSSENAAVKELLGLKLVNI